jgi:fluoride exporter
MSQPPPPTAMTAATATTVALGSGLGAVVRLSLSLVLASHPATASFPVESLAANTLGAFSIGVFAGWHGLLASPAQTPRGRFFFMAGFCGGLTTFSIFSLEILLLLEAGPSGRAVGYGAMSLAFWLAAAALGYRLTAGWGRGEISHS